MIDSIIAFAKFSNTNVIKMTFDLLDSEKHGEPKAVGFVKVVTIFLMQDVLSFR